jgi:hypothetical protein
MSAKCYRQALLEAEDGLFAVSVVSDVALDERGRIANPQAVIEEGSTIVAVEQGVMPVGDYIEEPHPLEIAEAERKAGSNGGGSHARRIRSSGPRFGTFMVRHNQKGGVDLRPMPSLGEFT